VVTRLDIGALGRIWDGRVEVRNVEKKLEDYLEEIVYEEVKLLK